MNFSARDSRVVVVSGWGGPEVLRVDRRSIPEPGTGEIRIHVHSAAVNPADALLRQGALGFLMGDLTGPFVPGLDVAGTVDAMGPGCSESFQLGDRVMAMVNPMSPLGGGYAEYVVVPEDWLAPAPGSVELAAAATLPMNGLTALQALDLLDLKSGSVLAITGGAGVLAGYLMQIARSRDIDVVADASPEDVGLVSTRGATKVIARGPQFAKQVRSTFPDGVDALVDTALLGPATLEAVRNAGTLARVRHHGEPGSYDVPAPPRGIRLADIFVPTYFGRQDKLAELRALVDHGVVLPQVADVLSADQAQEAHRRLDAGGVRGRLVLTFDPAATASPHPGS
jgi:NADPH:quinone reductase